MYQFPKRIRSLYNQYWRDMPLIRAALFLGTIITGIAVLLTALPHNRISSITIEYISDEHYQFLFALLLLVVYFFIVALLTHDQLQRERLGREVEAAFRYKDRGTLFNGTEPNIAFRIVTFHNILSEIGNQIGADKMPQALKSAGEKAASDFAANLKEIYENNIQLHHGGKHWDDLNFKDAINTWLEYDSRTGWGILTGRVDNKTLLVTVHHYEKLYNGIGGRYFGYFLAGYCQTIVTSILHSQAYKGCTTAVISCIDKDIKFESEETVKLHYVLK